VLAVFAIVIWVRDRRFPTRLTAVGLVVAACSGRRPLLSAVDVGDPLWRAVLSQYSNAGVWTPPHLHLIVLMGAPSCSHCSARCAEPTGRRKRLFAATWAATSVCLIYLPVVYQIKLLSGWQFPIAVLAAHAWHERIRPVVGPRVRQDCGRRPGSTCLIHQPLFVCLEITEPPSSQCSVLSSSRSGRRARLAVSARRPVRVVLAQSDIGQFVPNYGALAPTWRIGDGPIGSSNAVPTSTRFFRSDASDDWRQQLLSKDHVTLVVRTDWPRHLRLRTIRANRHASSSFSVDRMRRSIDSIRPSPLSSRAGRRSLMAGDLRSYLHGKSRSLWRYALAETVQTLFGWLPGLPGIGIRRLLTKPSPPTRLSADVEAGGPPCRLRVRVTRSAHVRLTSGMPARSGGEWLCKQSPGSRYQEAQGAIQTVSAPFPRAHNATSSSTACR